MAHHKVFVLTALLTSCIFARAQDADSTFLSLTETELTFEDSLSIFELIDSLLQNGDFPASQLALRVTYNSNVMSTGRTLGIENFGLSPGISYYHKSGLYADVSGYWSKDFDPSYYLTIASLGYMRDFSKTFSLLLGYDKYFYRMEGDNFVPYQHAFSISPAFEFKTFTLNAAYSFYFGDASAHRIMPGINLTLEKKNFLNIDRVAILPAFYLLFGDATITELEYVQPKSVEEAIQNFRKYGSRFGIALHDEKVFGLMNYAFSLPISASHKNWGFTFSYTYNIPKALPGEPLTLSKSSYLSGSLTYFIGFKRDKMPL
jgi:hypothetical protein